MHLSSLQPGPSLNVRVDHQLSPADSPLGVCSTFASGRSTSGMPGKAINQRWCQVDRLSNTDCAGPDSENFDVHDPTSRQQEPEQKTNDDDGSWQVVTRRRLRSKRQKTKSVVPGGKSDDARARNGACEQSASASQFPENGSADSRVTGQNQRLQLCRNDSISLSSITSCWFWPLFINSFARLSEVEWISLHATAQKFYHSQQTSITRDNFLRFHHMMTEGPQAIRIADDAIFLVGPFKVLMFLNKWSPDALLLSLVFDRIVPGFLTMLNEGFVNSLSGVNPKHSRLCTAITELLAQICQEDGGWLDRLGWQTLSLRNRCNLFSSMAFLFKQGNKTDLVRSLHQQVSGSWLEKHHSATVQRVSCDSVRRDSESDLRDLRASVRAIFSWLEGQIFCVGKTQERPDLIVRYADICQTVLEATDGLAPPPTALLLSLWRVVAQWSYRFRIHLTRYLGFDRTISLLDELLRKIDRWPDLDNLAFELRLILLGAILTKCEELGYKRNGILFSRAWCQYEKTLELLLDDCKQFMGDYRPPFAAGDESSYARLKEGARLDLMIRESAFYRLDCVMRKSTRQCIQHNLQICHRAFTKGWALNPAQRDVGAIELAQWYFLAGEHDAGVSSLMDIRCHHARLSWKKAALLADHGEFRAAVDELHLTRTLTTDPDGFDQRKRDRVDDQIAMTQLQWYRSGGGTDHLISAYRLCVDLIGRGDVRDRDVYEGALSHIVNAMRHSGLKFVDFARQASVLGYLTKNGRGIKSWQHLADLLLIRHKSGLTDVDTVDKVAREIGGKHYYNL